MMFAVALVATLAGQTFANSVAVAALHSTAADGRQRVKALRQAESLVHKNHGASTASAGKRVTAENVRRQAKAVTRQVQEMHIHSQTVGSDDVVSVQSKASAGKAARHV